MAKKVVAIVQARLESERFPFKLLHDLDGMPLIRFMLKRLAASQTLDAVEVVMPEGWGSSALIAAINTLPDVVSSVHAGDPNDVLNRYAIAAAWHEADVVVRLTGDCPLIDPEIVDDCVARFKKQDVDYLRTGIGYPEGLDVEVFSHEALQWAQENTTEMGEREHVTGMIWKNPERFNPLPLIHPALAGELRLTVDHPVDLEVVRAVVARLGADARMADIVALAKTEPSIFEPNQHIERNAKYAVFTGR